MGKKLKYVESSLVDLNAKVGLDIGADEIEYCDGSNTNIKIDEEEGWQDFGISMNDVSLKPVLETFEAMANGKLMNKALLGKKLDFDITFTGAKDITKALANGNTEVTYKFPSTPVNTTVDLTTVPTFAPDHLRIRVASTTGIVSGDEVIMLTGDATYGTFIERLRVVAVDTANETLIFKAGYKQFPEHGAYVKKITGYAFENKGTFLPNVKLRIRKKDIDRKALTVFTFDVLVEPVDRKLGKKTASEVALKFTVMPNAKITVNSNSTTSVEYLWNTEEVIL